MDLNQYLTKTQEAENSLDTPSCYALAHALISAWERGATVYLCGNGGSGSTASHWAQDLSKGTAPFPTIKGLKCICLADSVPSLTAWANDEGYEFVFSEQLRILGDPSDVLIAISGSGYSPNVLMATEMAQNMGMTAWGITGFDGGRLLKMADHCVHVPCDDMGMVESVHSALGHWLVSYLKEAFAAKMSGGFVEV